MGESSGATRSLVDLAAVVVSATTEAPQVLVVTKGDERDRLPAGPLASNHRTLDAGLRAWVEQQTHLKLGHVEQLYTFGDAGRVASATAEPRHDLSIAYLALVREGKLADWQGASWHNWYTYFPWEDWRGGRPRVIDALTKGLRRWVKELGHPVRGVQEDRIEVLFGHDGGNWDDERVLERFELLYEARLVSEARSGTMSDGSVLAGGVAMALDHRRILATAMSRLRGKIKYRPIIFELMPEAFTLLALQETVEALLGMRVHKQNFRRLVEAQGLVEETGAVSTQTGGRPARLVRFRREVLRERSEPGMRLAATRRIEKLPE